MGDGIKVKSRQGGKLIDVHIWEVYYSTYKYGYKVKAQSYSWNDLASGHYRYASGYTFDPYTGLYKLTNPSLGYVEYADMGSQIKNKYAAYGQTLKEGYTQLLYITRTWSDGQTRSIYAEGTIYTAVEDTSVIIPNGKGEATGRTVSSLDINAYPQDGAVGEYWYVYKRSYKKRA